MISQFSTNKRDRVEIKVSSQKNKKIANFRDELSHTIDDIDQEIKQDADEKQAAKDKIK